ncbi:MAG TPA: diaminopimelate decarboxylase [Candidatus Didemnitutus sp.]|nr:diaminopimelate decarboxylase [Candidatus Didemnitutus sp.]
MHHFRYDGPNLFGEGVDLAQIASQFGTPTYVYSSQTITDNYQRLAKSLAGLDLRICYALKACSNLAVLRHFANQGAAFDLVSGGELRRVVAAGGKASDSVFAGVGKSAAEIQLGLEAGVYSFHVESEPELERINEIAGRMRLKAPVAIRINPDVDAKTHAKITTGKSENKFGIPLAVAEAAYAAAARLPNLQVRGIQMHIGSQLTTVGPFVEAVSKVLPFVSQLKSRYGIEYFSIGGGIGIIYQDALASGAREWWDAKPDGTRPMTPEVYGAALKPLLAPLGMKILLEPGRFLVGNAGVLLSRVEYLKRGQGRNFVVVDAAMNDLVRPAMYEAYHEIVPLRRDATRASLTADIVGPVCESGDCFARDRVLPEVAAGELVAFMSAGAYGFSMAGRYNTRPMPAEVMIAGNRFGLVNQRESFDTMVAGEKIPDFLNP